MAVDWFIITQAHDSQVLYTSLEPKERGRSPQGDLREGQMAFQKDENKIKHKQFANDHICDWESFPFNGYITQIYLGYLPLPRLFLLWILLS
jgi:hypothetical protein